MHTLVLWAAALSLLPLAAGLALEVVSLLRGATAPPATGGPPAAPRRGDPP